MADRVLRSTPWTALRNRFVAAAALVLTACSGDGPSDPGELPNQRGALVVTVSGLPNEAQANVTVTGPGGFSRSVTATTTITGLSAGNYTLTVSDVAHEGSTYVGSPATQSLNVGAGATVNAPAVIYLISTGSLAITLGGLPESTPANIVITGPENFTRTLTAASSLSGLKPGAYSVEAREVQLTNARYAGAPSTQLVTVTASTTPVQAHVSYALSSGSLRIDVNGLPLSANAAITVTGPGTFLANVGSSTTLDNMVPGQYTITAASVTAGVLFVPAPTTQQVIVTASTTPVIASVTYTSTGTSLTVQVQGLPPNIPANIGISGPNGYTTSVAATQQLTGIPAGSYTITASTITVSCATYTPQPATQTLTVSPGQAQSASVSFSSGGSSGLNLCIDGAYITQAIQSYDNAVPLVAGRNALLRVFIRASVANSVQPSVRVRFYNGLSLVNTITITAPTASVPTEVDEATLTSSWNAALPGSLLQPGLAMLVDVDPTNAIAEANESDNARPANGSPGTLDLRTVAPLNVRLVPVIQAARGDTGRVNDSNRASFIQPIEKMFPVTTVDADIREPYTFTGPELSSGGGNWSALLSEINAARFVEGSNRMYYGVVRVGYTSGVAGLGYIGVPTALGWDHQPSGYEVMAHELGHNFGRFHAPCGNPSGVDNAYPYAGAIIGVYGYDIFANQLKFPVIKDFMSYCDPSWISDYNYNAILNFRASNPMPPPAFVGAASSARGLLVWGRIEQGRLVLEPGFEVDAPARLPERSGPHRIEGLGPSGEVLFSLSFSGDRIADAADPNDQSFAFVVPVSQLRGLALNRIRLSALGRQVERRSAGGAIPASAVRTASGRVRVAWNAAAAQVALIRNARTGQILSFARGGTVDLPAMSDDLDVTVSDGVRSIRSRLRPR